MVTTEEVKSDIASGKSKHIFYSANGLWWTHLPEELEAATQIGKRVSAERHEKMMNDPNIPEETKTKLKGLKAMADKATHTIPMDIEGNVLLQTDKPLEWFNGAISNPNHFGPHGIRAFMKAHHRNCDEIVFKNWIEVNKYLDIWDLIPSSDK